MHLQRFYFLAALRKNGTYPTPTASITGKRYYTTDTVTSYKDNIIQNQIAESYNQTSYFQFNQDGTGSQYFSGGITTFTYTIIGENITLNFPAQPLNGAPMSQYLVTLAIKQLTVNNLFLLYDESVVDGANTTRNTEAMHLSK